MKTTRASLPFLVVGLLFGALLGGAPALADRAECEASCATKGSESLQGCMERCPTPTGSVTGNKAGEFQSCATRCTDKYKKSFEVCSSRCPKDGPSGKKKAESIPDPDPSEAE